MVGMPPEGSREGREDDEEEEEERESLGWEDEEAGLRMLDVGLRAGGGERV